jgi:predicted transglutaminase-like cysteine proteinase
MAMRQYLKGLALVTSIAALFCASAADAAFFGLPLALKFQLDQIHFGTPVLPPLGHSRFCLRYPGECKVEGSIDLPNHDIALTPERWDELNSINREVNRDIVPEVSIASGATEEWLISPQSGDCKDYAVTKRHELLALGWPSRALLLSEVIVPSGEHHLVLVVRTKNIDLVLDNLNANIRSVAMTYRQYQWIRIESPQNPKFWASVNMPGLVRTATAAAAID